jgi:Uma2 family endonuclease
MIRPALDALQPSAPTVGRRMSYAQFLRLDEENNHFEWVDGRAIPMAAVTDEHSLVAGWLATLIRMFVEARKLGVVHVDPFQMKAAPDLPGRAPDILFVANRNLSRVKKLHVSGPADLVVEVISPGSRGLDRGNKFFEYEQGGVKEYWLIDPERKQPEFYLLGRDRLFRLANQANDPTYHSVVLKGLWLKPAWLWRRPLPTVMSVLKQIGVA